MGGITCLKDYISPTMRVTYSNPESATELLVPNQHDDRLRGHSSSHTSFVLRFATTTTETNNPTKSQAVDTTPTPTTTKQSNRASLILRNSSDHLWVAYKVQSNAGKKYAVTPACGLVAPGGTEQHIIVALKGSSMGCGTQDKMLVRCVGLLPVVADVNEEGGGALEYDAILWKRAPKSTQQKLFVPCSSSAGVDDDDDGSGGINGGMDTKSEEKDGLEMEMSGQNRSLSGGRRSQRSKQGVGVQRRGRRREEEIDQKRKEKENKRAREEEEEEEEEEEGWVPPPPPEPSGPVPRVSKLPDYLEGEEVEEVIPSVDEEVVELVEEEGSQNFDIGRKTSGPSLPKWNDGGSASDDKQEEESYPVLTPYLEGTSKTTLLPKCVEFCVGG